MSVLNAILFTLANKKYLILRVGLINFAVNTECRHSVIELKKSPLRAFFILLCCLFHYPAAPLEAASLGSCVSTHYDDEDFVDYVIDGDTLVLNDKRHVRLIGINTPELGREDKPAEKGAIAARDWLVNLFKDNRQVNLQYDKERFDRYGRTLAHLALPNKTNIQVLMLADGLAIPLTIPPNLLNQACYLQAAERAREQALGLWSSDRYKPRSVLTLNGSERGFYLLSGKLERITESQNTLWLNLENNVALSIIRKDLNYFNLEKLHSLKGKQIEARGWLYRKKGQLRMRIRHDSDIKGY